MSFTTMFIDVILNCDGVDGKLLKFVFHDLNKRHVILCC